MARSFCYLAVIAVAVAALCVIGGPQWAAAQGTSTPSAPDVIPPPKPPETPPKIEEVNDALELFKQRRPEDALTMLEKGGKKHPELPPGQIIVAIWFMQANQAYPARQWLDRAAFDVPEDPQAYAMLGSIALNERRVTDADLLFNKASALLKNFTKSDARKKDMEVQTLSGLAMVAQIHKQWPVAEQLLTGLTALVPKDTNVMFRLAQVLFEQRKAAESYAKLKEAYKTDPEHVLTPEARLGDFYEQFGDPANAKKWMDNALKVAPENLQTQIFVAAWALRTGQFDKAQTLASKALQINSASLEAKMLRGVVAMYQKDYKSAERYFEDAHVQSPGTFEAANNLALALCEQNDPAKKKRALEYARGSYQQNPRNAEAASTLGWVLFKNEDLDNAELALQQATQGGNLSSDTAYYIAQLDYTRGRKERARALVEAALKSAVPFVMRPEAQQLLDKLKSEPKPSKP
jgi:Tfp pilus assembly protein PilF